MDSFNLFEFDTPGIYQIVCKKNNFIYYGQTSCFIRRCFQHLQQLKKGCHACESLQKDWNLYTQKDFTFEVICIEDSSTQRFKRENQLISNASEAYLYNTKDQTQVFKNKPRISQKIRIDATEYRSIAEASRQLKRSSRIIRMYLDDPTKPNYERLELHRPNYTDEFSIIIDGVFYKTTSCVIEKGLATTTRQVRDRCRCKKKWSNWILVKRMSNDYPDRE